MIPHLASIRRSAKWCVGYPSKNDPYARTEAAYTGRQAAPIDGVARVDR